MRYYFVKHFWKINIYTHFISARRLVKYTRFSFRFPNNKIKKERKKRWGERFSILFYYFTFFFYLFIYSLYFYSSREYKYLCTKLYRFSVTGENNTLLYCVTFSLVQQVWLIFSLIWLWRVLGLRKCIQNFFEILFRSL